MECDADGAVRPFVFQQDCDNPSHLVARRGLKLVSDVLRVRRTQRQLGCISYPPSCGEEALLGVHAGNGDKYQFDASLLIMLPPAAD